MSNIITDSSAGAIKRPHDPYWDSPPTRYEVQKQINVLCQSQMALMNMIDTANIVLNYIAMKKLNITRAELDIFVADSKAEMEKLQREQQVGEAQVRAQGLEIPNNG